MTKKLEHKKFIYAVYIDKDILIGYFETHVYIKPVAVWAWK